MYVALFIIMDSLILALLLIAVYFLIKKLQEKHEEENPPIENDLGEFRNGSLHEKARKDRDRLAHIEEVAGFRNLPDETQVKESDD